MQVQLCQAAQKSSGRRGPQVPRLLENVEVAAAIVAV